MTYPHRRSEFSGSQFSNCRCGNSIVCWPDVTSVPPLEWGANCPAAMRDEIAALRAQVEDLKKERPAAVAFLRARRDKFTSADLRDKFTRAATDIENGAHHRV